MPRRLEVHTNISPLKGFCLSGVCQVNLCLLNCLALALLPCVDCCLTRQSTPHKSSPTWHELRMHWKAPGLSAPSGLSTAIRTLATHAGLALAVQLHRVLTTDSALLLLCRGDTAEADSCHHDGALSGIPCAASASHRTDLQSTLRPSAVNLEAGCSVVSCRVPEESAMSHVGVVAIAVGLHNLRLLVPGADISTLGCAARACPVSKLDHQRLSWRHLHQHFASASEIICMMVSCITQYSLIRYLIYFSCS